MVLLNPNLIKRNGLKEFVVIGNHKQKISYKMKLVFDYTYCSEPECWDLDLPFEYESKDKFILDVLDNPMLLNKIGIQVWEHEVEDESIFSKDFIENINYYVLTIDEWFEKNKIQI
jgi:hypothetical protein